MPLTVLTLIAAYGIRDKQERITMSARKGFEKLSEKKAHNKETHPERGTKRYAQNEKIIKAIILC